MEKIDKVPGIYPGCIENISEIENMVSSELFLYINFFFNITKDKSQLNYKDSNFISEEEYALDYLIYQTIKYGVNFPPLEKGKRIEKNESFIEWYITYYDYFRSVLSDDEYYTLQKNIEKNLNLYLVRKK